MQNARPPAIRLRNDVSVANSYPQQLGPIPSPLHLVSTLTVVAWQRALSFHLASASSSCLLCVAFLPSCSLTSLVLLMTVRGDDSATTRRRQPTLGSLVLLWRVLLD